MVCNGKKSLGGQKKILYVGSNNDQVEIIAKSLSMPTKIRALHENTHQIEETIVKKLSKPEQLNIEIIM